MTSHIISRAFFIFTWCITIFFPLCSDDRAFLPENGRGEIIHHDGFVLQYNNEREQADWVAYELTREEVLNKVAKRKDNFRSDPEVDLGSSQLEDYRGSGFDRGHLVPAADLAWSHESMSDSFFMSNMSPQDPSFNRGIWKKLEEQVRQWAIEHEKIYVITGCLYLEDRGAIGKNHVDVPSHYYKIIFDGHGDRVGGLALALPNEGSKDELWKYTVSIDEVERVSGLDFFRSLDDSFEDKIEGKENHNEWSWGESQNVSSYQSVVVDGNKEEKVKGEGIYWITRSSSKRHNSGCRYFQKTKGRLGSRDEGVACKVCGG
jgi:endonuclease G